MNSKLYEPAVYYNTFTKLFSLYGIHNGPVRKKIERRFMLQKVKIQIFNVKNNKV